jgi:hypothetical protein
VVGSISAKSYNFLTMKFPQEGKAQPAGTQFLGLVDSLIDLFKDPDVSNVDVVFINYKTDDKGERVVEDGMHVAEIRAVGIRAINVEVQEELRKMWDLPTFLGLLVLWLHQKNKKLGILKFHPMIPGPNAPKAEAFAGWEKTAIAAYAERNKKFMN